MCDHINRVHKDLDATKFMKKSRRSKKSSKASSGAVTPVNIKIETVSGSRKSSSGRSKKEKCERKCGEYLQRSQEILRQLDDPYNRSNKKLLKDLKTVLEKYEDMQQTLLTEYGD
jgi:hypothetical protein